MTMFQQLSTQMEVLGYQWKEESAAFNPAQVEARLQYDMKVAIETSSNPQKVAIELFIQRMVHEGDIVPVIAKNDVDIAFEVLKERFMTATGCPAETIIHEPLYKNVASRFVNTGWQSTVLEIKASFVSVARLYANLITYFREEITEMLNDKQGDVVEAPNLHKALENLPEPNTSPLFIVRLREELTAHKANLLRLISEESPHLGVTDFAIRAVYTKQHAIEVVLTTARGSHRFMLTTEGVTSLSSGYSLSKDGALRMYTLGLSALDVPMIRMATTVFRACVINAQESNKFAQLTSVLDAQDVKRLNRMMRYLKTHPFKAKGNGQITETRDSAIQWLFEGDVFLLAPHYLLSQMDAHMIFCRTTTQTPLQEVQTSLKQGLHSSNLPVELKQYLAEMYLQTTDLRIKL